MNTVSCAAQPALPLQVFREEFLQNSSKKLCKFVEDLCSSPYLTHFTFPNQEIYNKFLISVANNKHSLSNEAVYIKMILLFKNTFGIPEEVLPSNVEFYHKENLLFSCPKELLYFDFKESSSPSNEPYKLQLEKELSEEALCTFKQYLYRGRSTQASLKSLCELYPVAKTLNFSNLQLTIQESLIPYWVKDENKDSFRPEWIEGTPFGHKFAKCYLEEKQVKIFNTSFDERLIIPLSDFISIFYEKNSPIQSFVTQYVTELIVDVNDFELLCFIPKQYRKIIQWISFPSPEQQHWQNVEKLFTYLPNSGIAPNNAWITTLQNEAKTSTQAGLHKILGILLVGSCQESNGEQALRKAQSYAPDDDRILTYLGELLLLKKDLDIAIEYLEKAIECNPKGALAYGSLSEALRMKGDYDKAIPPAKRAIELNPNSAIAYATLGAIFLQKKDLHQAIPLLEKATTLNSRNIFACTMLGKALELQGDFDKATPLLIRTLTFCPMSSDIYTLLVNIFAKKNNFTIELPLLERAVARNASNAAAFALLGDVHRRSLNFFQAKEALAAAIRLNPNDPFALTLLGDVLRVTGHITDLDAAIPVLEKSIGLNPHSAFTYGTLGDVLRQKQMYIKAIESLNKAIELDQTYVFAQHTLGIVFVQQGFLDKGIPLLESSIHAAPSLASVLAYKTLGDALRQKDLPDQAISALERGLKFYPGNTTIQEELNKIRNQKIAQSTHMKPRGAK